MNFDPVSISRIAVAVSHLSTKSVFIKFDVKASSPRSRSEAAFSTLFGEEWSEWKLARSFWVMCGWVLVVGTQVLCGSGFWDT